MSSDLKKQSHEEFVSWSKSYDRSLLQLLLFAPSHKRILRELARQKPAADVHILDVGCGTGKLAHHLITNHADARVFGIDLCESMLQMACHRVVSQPRIHLSVADSEHLPFDDSSFDFVTCSNSFHHYPNQLAAVREMHRVLKPGGRLLLIDGYRDSFYGHFIYDVIVTRLEGGNVSHASATKFQELFRESGFGSIEQQIVHFPAPFIMTLAQAVKAKKSEPRVAAYAVEGK